MKKLILITLSFVMGNLVNSQTNSNNCTLTSNANYCNSANNYPIVSPRVQNETFSDYFLKSDELKWKQATILLNNEPKTVSARYNVLYDDIEVKDNNKTYKLVERPHLNVTFSETNETYQYISYYGNDGHVYSSYFIVDDLSDELGVFKKQSFKKSRDRYYGNYKVVKDYMYYMLDANNKLCHLTTNRRTIKKAFPEEADAILNFVKKNKINKRNQNDLISLARYINSLIKDKQES